MGAARFTVRNVLGGAGAFSTWSRCVQWYRGLTPCSSITFAKILRRGANGMRPRSSSLRKSSLDELPQLWNVLKGDMSLVGPRPMMVDQEALYPGRAYFELRPGITGPWQVSDRNESSFADRARFDNQYLDSLSLSVDLTILFRTVAVVLRCTGY